MCKLIRLFHDHLEYFFVRKSEDGCKRYDRFHDELPDSLRYSEFNGFFLNLSEQPSDGFIVIKPLYKREDVVLQGDDGGVGDLLCKVLGLTLAQAKQSLALLKDDFLRPSLGVDPVCLEEVQSGVRGDESAPLPMLGAPYEEHPAADSGELDISRYVPAPEFAAILLRVLLVEVPDECRGGEVIFVEVVLGLALLANLDAAEIVALDTAGVHKAYDLLACEPAVRKKILEADTLPDGFPHHIHRKGDFILVILLDALARRGFLIALGSISCVKLFLRHPVILLSSFLPNKGEVKQHLRDTVRYAEKESLETEDTPVLKVGVDAADTFHSSACLWEIGVIDYQACRTVFVVGTDLYTGPKLEVDVVHELSPVDAHITQETIEHVLLAAQEAA